LLIDEKTKDTKSNEEKLATPCVAGSGSNNKKKNTKKRFNVESSENVEQRKLKNKIVTAAELEECVKRMRQKRLSLARLQRNNFLLKCSLFAVEESFIQSRDLLIQIVRFFWRPHLYLEDLG